MKLLASTLLLLSALMPLMAQAQFTGAPTTVNPYINPTLSSCPNGQMVNGVCNLTYTPLEPIPGLNTQNPDLPTYLSTMYTIVITLGCIIAVVMLTVSAVQLMVAESVEVITHAKKRMWGAVWGLIILVGSFLILYTINPALLRFNLVIPSQNAPGISGNIAGNNPFATAGTVNSTPCGSLYQNGCGSGAYCGNETTSGGSVVQTCLSNSGQTANQACTAAGGAWSLYVGGNGNFCYLGDKYKTQQDCTQNGYKWGAPNYWGTYCYQ